MVGEWRVRWPRVGSHRVDTQIALGTPQHWAGNPAQHAHKIPEEDGHAAQVFLAHLEPILQEKSQQRRGLTRPALNGHSSRAVVLPTLALERLTFVVGEKSPKWNSFMCNFFLKKCQPIKCNFCFCLLGQNHQPKNTHLTSGLTPIDPF